MNNKPSKRRLRRVVELIQRATGRSPSHFVSKTARRSVIAYKHCAGCHGTGRSPLDGISPDGIPASCSWCGGTGEAMR